MTRWESATFDDVLAIEVKASRSWQSLRDQLPAEPTPQLEETLRENARTLWSDDGQQLACVGISPMWKGVGAAWALVSEAATQRPIALSRGTLEWLCWIVDRDGLWRVQATVEQGRIEARRWLIWMGFSYEGTMRAYSHTGAHHDLYARV